jgi:hypothetical protein
LLLGLTQRAIDDAKAREQVSSAVESSAVAFNLFASYFMVQLVWLGAPEPFGEDPRDALRPLFAAQLAPVLRSVPVAH